LGGLAEVVGEAVLSAVDAGASLAGRSGIAHLVGIAEGFKASLGHLLGLSIGSAVGITIANGGVGADHGVDTSSLAVASIAGAIDVVIAVSLAVDANIGVGLGAEFATSSVALIVGEAVEGAVLRAHSGGRNSSANSEILIANGLHAFLGEVGENSPLLAVGDIFANDGGPASLVQGSVMMEHALSGVDIAGVSGAALVVVADSGSVDASEVGITSVVSARIAVVAVLQSVHASQLGVTEISGAGVVVIARADVVPARGKSGVAEGGLSGKASLVNFASDEGSLGAVFPSVSLSAFFESVIIARSVDLVVAGDSGFSLAHRLAHGSFSRKAELVVGSASSVLADESRGLLAVEESPDDDSPGSELVTHALCSVSGDALALGGTSELSTDLLDLSVALHTESEGETGSSAQSLLSSQAAWGLSGDAGVLSVDIVGEPFGAGLGDNLGASGLSGILAGERIAASGLGASVLAPGELGLIAGGLIISKQASSGGDSLAVASRFGDADAARPVELFGDVQVSVVEDSDRSSVVSLDKGDVLEASESAGDGGGSGGSDHVFQRRENIVRRSREVLGGLIDLIGLAGVEELGLGASGRAASDVHVSAASGVNISTGTARSDRAKEALARVDGTSDSSASLSASLEVEVEAVGSALGGEHAAFFGGSVGAVASSEGVSSGGSAGFSASGSASGHKGGSALDGILRSSISASADSSAEAVAPHGVVDHSSARESPGAALLAGFSASSGAPGNKSGSAIRILGILTTSLDSAKEAIALVGGVDRVLASLLASLGTSCNISVSARDSSVVGSASVDGADEAVAISLGSHGCNNHGDDQKDYNVFHFI
jgi:hypothetical protein